MLSLIFQVGGATVPDLGLVEGGIDHGRRVAHAVQFVDTLGSDKRTVGECLLGIVTGRAGDLAGTAEAGLVEQPITQGDLGIGLWIGCG